MISQLELSSNIELYDIMGELSKNSIDKEISQDIWHKFVQYSNYVGNSGRFIKYPAKEYQKQGIPAPRQIIAWRKLIRAHKVFCVKRKISHNGTLSP